MLKKQLSAILAKLSTDARCIEAGIQEDNEPELVGQSFDQILSLLKEEIEKSLLKNEEIRGSCLGKGYYFAGESDESATASESILMPQFRNVAQAQLDKVLKILT